MRRRTILLILALAVAGMATAMTLATYWVEQPRYGPGDVREARDLDAPLEPPAQEQTPGYWQVTPEIRLRHFSVGAGQPILVLHGGPGHPLEAPFTGLQSLADPFVFHYYHQRGTGESTRATSSFAEGNTFSRVQSLSRTLGLQAQVADVERIRRLLNHDRWVLVGHSYGAFLATMYATEFPERVAGLVLIAPPDLLLLPPASGGIYTSVHEALPESDKRAFFEWVQDHLDLGRVFEKTEEELVSEQLRFLDYFAAAYGPIPKPAQPRPEHVGPYMAAAQYLSMGQRHDYSKSLRDIEAPVLIVHGERDLQPLSVAVSYRDMLPHAQIEVISEVGHFPHEEAPQRFAQVVGPFLRRVTGMVTAPVGSEPTIEDQELPEDRRSGDGK